MKYLSTLLLLFSWSTVSAETILDNPEFPFDVNEAAALKMRSGDIAKLEFAKAIISRDATQYLDGDIEVIQLSQLSGAELRLLRNTIYARHGFVFKSADLRAYFTKKKWYIPNPKWTDALLTAADNLNLTRISGVENRVSTSAAKSVNAADLVGVWQNSKSMASGWGERLLFYTNGSVKYVFSSMIQLSQAEMLVGTYGLVDNLLLLEFSNKRVIEHNDEMTVGPAMGYAWTRTWIKEIPTSLSAKLVVSPYNSTEKPAIDLSGEVFYLYFRNPDEGLRN